MKINLKTTNKILFYIAYFFFLLYAFFGTINIFEKPLKLLTNISIIIIFLSFIFNIKKYNYNELIKLIFCLSLSLVYIIKTGNYVFLKLILIIIVSKNIEIEKRILFDIKFRIIFLILMFLLCKIGVATDNIAYFHETIRHSIGFSNPNVFGMHMFILCLELLYIYRKKLSFFKMFNILLIMIVSNVYSGSRTSLYVFILSLILFALYRYKDDIFQNKFVKFIIIWSPLITSLIIYILYKFYINGSNFGIQVDKILSGRLLNTKFFSTNYPINIFGSNIAEANKSCDITAAYMLYAFGISGLCIYLFSFVKLIKKLYKRNDLALVLIVFSLIIYGVSEKLWLFADCNILITVLSVLIFNVRNEEKKE